MVKATLSRQEHPKKHTVTERNEERKKKKKKRGDQKRRVQSSQ